MYWYLKGNCMKDKLLDYMKEFTQLDDAALKKIADDVPIATFLKGTVLLEQGDIPSKCYFVLDGLVRKYGITEEGNEITYDFYTKNQAVAIFGAQLTEKPSNYTLVCAEDSVLVVGDLDDAEDVYQEHDGLENMIRNMMESMMGELQEHHAVFISSSPEERYRYILENRPTLINRVPQHQLASYLGIKPESLSRIKRRILKVVD